mmetsp:Transcript_63661/g.140190  ORF Transcript_63661/g.140190 Transcript_63661/m.140190 type:complete len:1247 (-) Transcript_63661:76-3816(-)
MPKMAMQREGFEPTKTSGQKQQKLQAEAGLQKQHGQNRQHQQQAQSQQQQEHTRKVKFCMYHLQGVCKFTADECLFAHSTEEMQRSRGARRKKADNTEKPKGGQSFLQDENLNTGACDWRLADPAATSEGVHGCSRDQNPPLRFEHMGHDDVSTNPQNQPGRWPILPEPMFVAPVGPMQPNMAKNKFPEGATDMQAPRAPPLNASAVAAAAAAAMGLVPGHPAAGWMAAAAVAGKSVFGYNRECFMEDREQRMKKEFAERKFRNVQAGLWRQDVRDIVSLTEKKMTIYLLVNVMFLGFTFNLWCEGRLPPTTPDWLIMGQSLATVSSFVYMLLTVVLATHASIVAQAYQTRMMTQLVRLPVPTWAELEACRTSASDFERVEPSQMFRVPFAMGVQERIGKNSAKQASDVASFSADSDEADEVADAQKNAAAEANAAAGSAASLEAAASASPAQMASDPWGLERRGDDIYELGIHHGQEVAKLRHIKLIRQAAAYFQTYDAFARVSMSIGVNQLMLALSYFIIAYCYQQVENAFVAIPAVAILMASAWVIARIDLTLSPMAFRLIQFLLLAGPAISCFAACNLIEEHPYRWTTVDIAPAAFFSHGIVVMLLTVSLRVTTQENGAALPLAFQGVLLMDVFGWVWHKSAVDNDCSIGSHEQHESTSSMEKEREAAPAEMATQAEPEVSDPWPTQEGEHVSFYMEGYGFGSEPSSGSGQNLSKDSLGKHGVAYDTDGRPMPFRPEEARLDQGPGSAQDMRTVKGAPRLWEVVDAAEAPARDFWHPVSFMPADARHRDHLGDYLGGASAELVTGHEKASPGLLPWRIFKSASLLISVFWFLGGAYYFCEKSKKITAFLGEEFTDSRGHQEEHHSSDHGAGHHDVGHPVAGHPDAGHPDVGHPEVGHHNAVQHPAGLNFFGYWSGAVSSPAASTLERVEADWPYPNMVPRSLSCDASGRHLLVSDGLSAFKAEIELLGASTVASPLVSTRPGSLRRAASAAAPAATASLGADKVALGAIAAFRRAPVCGGALLGEALDDAALVCDSAAGRGAACEALYLYRHGHRVVACPLAGAGHQVSVANISNKWLEGEDEKASWLVLDQDCRTQGGTADESLQRGCALVGTTRGRAARLRPRGEGASGSWRLELEVVADESGHGSVRSNAAMRGLSGGRLALLEAGSRAIQILDATSGDTNGPQLLPLPRIPTAVDSFCVGGDYLFLLGHGAEPGLWRMPAPSTLLGRPAKVEVAPAAA